jgi:hypothetical protein
MAYKVVRLTGDYEAREAEAKRRGCAMVLHQHLNSVADPKPSYTLVEVAYPTTARELKCARDAAANYETLLKGGLGYGSGVRVLKDGDRGESIIDNTLEAYISEPLFASNPTQAKWVAKPESQRALARAAVDAIQANYPDGSVIGLSIGHIGKTSNPRDRGARVVGTGLTEAAVCTEIIAEMERLLLLEEETDMLDCYEITVVATSTAALARLRAKCRALGLIDPAVIEVVTGSAYVAKTHARKEPGPNKAEELAEWVKTDAELIAFKGIPTSAETVASVGVVREGKYPGPLVIPTSDVDTAAIASHARAIIGLVE